MQAKLVVVEPHAQPEEYMVTLPTTIGRGREATLQLTHALVSRQHCQLFAEQGRIMVRDLGSMNGTFVGGQRVETAPLSSGELLTVGKSRCALFTAKACSCRDREKATPPAHSIPFRWKIPPKRPIGPSKTTILANCLTTRTTIRKTSFTTIS